MLEVVDALMESSQETIEDQRLKVVAGMSPSNSVVEAALHILATGLLCQGAKSSACHSIGSAHGLQCLPESTSSHTPRNMPEEACV